MPPESGKKTSSSRGGHVKKRIILTTIGIAVLALGVVTASYAAKSSSHKAAATKFKVGLVTDIGGLNDRGFNHLSYLGLQRSFRPPMSVTRPTLNLVAAALC